MRQHQGKNTVYVGAPRTKRPIDKQLIGVTQTVTDAGQTSTLLYTATYPGTVTGLRWDLNMISISDTAHLASWAIVISGQGYAPNTLNLGNTSSLYVPEENVLAYGDYIGLLSLDSYKNFDGATKTMRKLQAGDTLSLVAVASITDSCQLYGHVQFFIKG